MSETDHTLTYDRWTVMADRPADVNFGGWRWLNPYLDHRTLMRMAEWNDAVVMRRIVGDRMEVVARLAGPAWKRLQTRWDIQREARRAA